MSCMRIPSTMKDVIHAIQGWAGAWFFYTDEDTGWETVFYKAIQFCHLEGIDQYPLKVKSEFEPIQSMLSL